MGHTIAAIFYLPRQLTCPAEVVILMERVARNLWPDLIPKATVSTQLNERRMMRRTSWVLMSRSRSGTNYFYSYSVAIDSSHYCLHVTFAMKIISLFHGEVNYISIYLKFGFGYWINLWGFPCGSDGKESICNAEDPGSIPVLGRSRGGRNDNPLQYSCMENFMDRGVWWTTVHGVSKSQICLSD